MSRVQFIPPALPKLRASPPTGANWQFELKFDGYRVQLYKAGPGATIFSKKRADFIRRFPDIAAAVVGLGKREVRRVECNNPAFGFQCPAELEFEAGRRQACAHQAQRAVETYFNG